MARYKLVKDEDLNTTGVIVNEGTIDLDCAASNTGSVKWTVLYYPIDEGAAIVAA